MPACLHRDVQAASLHLLRSFRSVRPSSHHGSARIPHHRGDPATHGVLFKGPLRAAAVQAQQALAFVARQEGQASMEASRWRHVMSLELGWMSPGQAARYVEAAHHAGLLVADGDALRLSFDPRIDIPRGFRPDPDDLPAPADEKPDDDASFPHWLSKLASARGEDAGQTMAAVEELQQAAGGLLHAEAALLALAHQAGLDVRAAAQMALKRLRA